MDRYKETFKTWDKVASLYQDKFMNLDLYDFTYDFFCSSIVKKHVKILDIGCGPGNITRYLLFVRPDFQILGVDISPNMIALARDNNPLASFAIMDSRQIDKIADNFDGIICGFCLPYLSQTDVTKLIIDCNNLLNAGGLFYLSFVEGDPSQSGFKFTSTGDRSYFYFHKSDSLKAKLAENNFEEISVFNVEYRKSESQMELHTILTARKKTTA